MSSAGLDQTVPHDELPVPHTSPHHDADAQDEDHTADSYPAPDDHLVAPPNFRPFFTLVEDSSTGEHHHPEVHYIFSDDDPDTLTNSILDASHDNENASRIILVDFAPDGRTLKSCHSLSSTWQVSNTQIEPAPLWTEAGPEAATEGLMLRVQGGGPPVVDEKKREQADTLETMEANIEAFNNRMVQLQGVLEKAAIT